MPNFSKAMSTPVTSMEALLSMIGKGGKIKIDGKDVDLNLSGIMEHQSTAPGKTLNPNFHMDFS